MWTLTLQPPNGPPRDYALEAGTIRLGRSLDNDIVVADESASPAHAEIDYHRDSDTVILRDLHSQHGTFVNEERIGEPHLLHPRDEIRIGLFVARLSRLGSGKPP